MADIQSNIQVNIDAGQALAQLKALQKEISLFYQSIAAGSASAAKAQANFTSNLVNSINNTGKFRASLQEIKSTSEAFTDSLERNKFSTREYFRYAGGATKTFGRLFKSEFDTIGKVAEERVKTMQTQYIKMGRDANGAIKSIAVRPLSLDMENLATKTALAAQKQQLFNQLLKQGSTNLLNFGKNTQWAGRQLMVGFTIPIVMLGTQAGKTFMALEKQAIRFKRVYGEMFTTQEDTEKALKNVELLAKEFTKYGVAIEKTMEIAADAAATGKMGADLIAQVSEATRLAVLGGVEQQQALETTISLTNSFGIAADQLRSKIDFLNAVENQTLLSIEDLTIAIPKAGPVVKQLGGDVEDLAFFLTAMREGGINASEGANALKSGLASLINPSKKAAAMLKDLGVDINGIVESNKGDIKATVVGFAQALDTLAPLERSRAIEQLFGKFQFARLSTLFQNITKDGTQASRTLNLTKASVEELAILSERELKKVEDATGTKFKKSIEDLKATLAPVGEQFLKALTPIVEFIGKILNWFNSLSDGTKKTITKIVAVLGVVGPVFLMTFGLISNLIANGIKLFANLRKGFMSLGGQSKILGNQTNYMTSEQIEAATVAASLDQAHSRLIQTFKIEASAANQLAAAYQRGTLAASNFAKVNPGAMRPGGVRPRKFNKGGVVPGSGNRDTVPALLTPGEFVVNKDAAKGNERALGTLNSGGFVKRALGTLRRPAQFLGMPSKTPAKAQERQSRQLQADQIAAETWKSPRIKTMKPAEYAERVSPSSGHSFPSSSVGGVYKKSDGSQVFVKPMPSEKAALAEMRANEIARDVHGLISPKSKLVLIKDPNDPTGHRQYFALESPVDKRLATPSGKFTKKETFSQLVASLLRGDKDLSPGNMGGKVLVDPGTSGVFDRASGLKNEFAPKMPSMEDQAMINLLGVKGGAKKFFAQATSGVAKGMSPKEYDVAIKDEIRRILPKLETKVSSMNLTPEEIPAYEGMVQRLRDGLNVDWSKFQPIHAKALPLNRGGFVLRSTGSARGTGNDFVYGPSQNIIDKSAKANLGTMGTVALHFTEEGLKYKHRLDRPSYHQEGSKFENYRQTSGVTIFGPQGYNQFTNSYPDVAVTPYPFTYDDAIETNNKLRSHIDMLKEEYDNEPLLRVRKKIAKQQKAARIALAELQADIKSITSGGKTADPRLAYREAMADRYALTTSMAEGETFEDRKKPNSTYARKRAQFIRISELTGGRDTVAIRRVLTGIAVKEHKKGLLTEKGMTDKGEKITAGKKGKKGSPKLRFDAGHNSLVEQEIKRRMKERDSKGFRAMSGLMPRSGAYNEGKFMPGVMSRTMARHGFFVPTRSKGTQQYGEPATVPALVTPGEMVLNEKTTQQYGPALQYVNSGGVIKMRSGGTMQNGIVPGIGNKDTVPMMLNQGSFVVNKGATQKNRGFLNTIAMRNEGTDDPFANIGMPVAKNSASSAGKTIGQAFLGVVKSGGKAIGNAMLAPTMRQVQADLKEVDAQHEVKMRELQGRFSNGNDPSWKTGGTVTGSEITSARARAARERAEAAFVSTGFYRGSSQRKEDARKERLAEQKNNAKLLRKEQGRQIGARVGGGMMGASMALGAMSMAPGKTGEFAQKAMPIVGMASMVAPMVGSKAGAVVAPLAALAAATIALRMAFDKAQDAALELGEATGSSTKVMQGFAEFSGKATGTEIMDRRRLAARGQLVAATGKTTFGEAFVQSEQGKNLAQSFAENVKNKNIGKEGAAKDLKAQLTTSVLSGALTAEQAQSVAANIGASMGDSTIGVQIAGELQGIFGKNGEDITKNGVEIRTRLMQESTKTMTGSIDRLKKGTSESKYFSGLAGMNNNVKNVGGVLAGAGTGAYIGSVIGSFVGPIGTGIGALVGTAIGGIVGGVGAYFANKANVKKMGALSGAAVADAAGMMEQSKQLLDSYELEYKQRREQLVLEKKISEIKELDAKYEANRPKLIAEQTKQREAFLEAYKGTQGNARAAMDTALDKQMTRKYKGTAQEVYVGAAKENLNTALDQKLLTGEQVAQIKVQINAGELNPRDAMKIFETFNNKEDMANVMTIMTKLGGEETSAAMDIVSAFQTQDGKPIPKLKSEFVAQLSTKSDKDAQPFIEMMQGVTALGGVLKLDTEIDYILKNENAQKEITQDLKAIQENKGKFDVKFLSSIDVELPKTIDPEYFKTLTNPEEQKKYISTISTLLNIDDQVLIKDPGFLQWQKETGPLGGAQYSKLSPPQQLQKYREAMGQKVSQSGVDMSLAPTGGKTGTGTGKRDTTFDDMMKKLKLFQQASVNAMGGFKELQRVMNLPGKKGGAAFEFNGVINQLRETGQFNTDFLSMLEGLSPEELQKQLKKFGVVLKNGKVQFNKSAVDINKALASIAAGEAVSENQKKYQELQNRISAVNILRSKGVSYETAMQMAESDAIALAIKSGQLKGKALKEMINSYKKLTAAEKYFQKITMVRQQGQLKKQELINNQVLAYFDFLKSAVEASVVKEKTEIELRNEKNGLLLEQISYEEDIINNAYDKQIERLDAQRAIQEEINQLQSERLGLAQALSQGDMAGAARAIQSIREQEALAQIEAKRKALEEERKRKLGTVTAGGQTRTQIEDQQKTDQKTMTELNLYVFAQMEQVRANIEKMTTKTPEQLAAFESLAKEAKDLGLDFKNINFESLAKEAKDRGLDFKNINVKDAIDLAISGMPMFLLEGVTKSIDKYLTDVGAKYFRTATGLEVGAPPPLDKITGEFTGLNTSIASNITALNANTKALGRAVSGGVGGGSGTKPQGSSTGSPSTNSPTNNPTNVSVTDAKDRLKWNPNAKGPNVPQQVIDALNNEATKVKGAIAIAQAAAAKVIATTTAVTKSKEALNNEEEKYRNYLNITGKQYLSNRGFMSRGGLVPKYFASGGFSKGTDTVPAMLTPGEFVVRKSAVDALGVSQLHKINDGNFSGGNFNSVYNYGISVNVTSSNANPNEIARTVINQIKQIDAQRIRSYR